jgi:hypothetical protein
MPRSRRKEGRITRSRPTSAADGAGSQRTLEQGAPDFVYAGPRIQAVTTVLDVWSPWKLVRLAVTMVVDMDSRMVIAFDLSDLESTSVLGAFRRAFGLDTQHEGLPVIPPPNQVYLDHGPEHRGVLGDQLSELGVQEIVWEIPYDPVRTGRVEGLFRKLTSQIFTTAVWTRDRLEEEIRRCAIRHNQQAATRPINPEFETGGQDG